MKIRFDSDYLEGAHPRIIEKLVETNLVQTIGYGEDGYCKSAKEKIKKEIGRDDVDIHFFVGGTQTNLTMIASALKAYQGVISADSGHINVHETGSIEATGHKVLALPSVEGKINAKQVEDLVMAHRNDESMEHTVQPKMVYISHPTETGSLYTKKELVDLYEVCEKLGLYFFLDGARLGYGLMAKNTDVTMQDIANNTHSFYIGGTKVGALFGEALVISKEELKGDFRYMIKQKGGMLAKGRLLGVQFDTLFTDGLYCEIAKHAIELSDYLQKNLEEMGIKFYHKSESNQLFPIFSNKQVEKLSENFSFSNICPFDESNTVIRFCTSWATPKSNVDKLIVAIRDILG